MAAKDAAPRWARSIVFFASAGGKTHVTGLWGFSQILWKVHQDWQSPSLRRIPAFSMVTGAASFKLFLRDVFVPLRILGSGWPPHWPSQSTSPSRAVSVVVLQLQPPLPHKVHQSFNKQAKPTFSQWAFSLPGSFYFYWTLLLEYF